MSQLEMGVALWDSGRQCDCRHSHKFVHLINRKAGTHARARGSVNQIRKDLCVRLLTDLPAGRPGVLVFGGVGSCHLFVAV